MKKRRYGLLGGVAAVAAGAIIGALVALTSSANAAGTTPAPSSYGSTSTPGDGDGRGPGGHAGEASLSSSLTAKLKQEALKAVPGGTVDRVESDSGDATYEAHMTKSDGSQVTVKFDKAGKVSAVEAGMGK